jgi:cell division protein FtsL
LSFLYLGETDECEYLKERLGDLSHHPLAAFFGLNYVETGYLTVVVLTQVLLILLTAVVIHIRKRQLAAQKRK